jgi:hypothetical protein
MKLTPKDFIIILLSIWVLYLMVNVEFILV